MKTYTDDIKAEFNKPNNVTIQLVLLNVAVWAFLSLVAVLGYFGLPKFEYFTNSLFIIPNNLELLLFRPWTIVTYAFTHFGFGHIILNLLGLYWFGRMLQDLIGSNRVLGIYLLSGITGGIAYVIFILILGLLPAKGGLTGASGAVLGIVVAMATLSPNYKVHMMFIGPVAIKWIAAVFVFISIIGLKDGNAGGELAHLGGALMGFIFIKQLNNGNDLGRPLVDFIYSIPTIFKKKSKMKVSHRSNKKSAARNTSNNSSADTVSQEEIDRILDKISKSGYPSLTKEEKGKLFKYSNK
jgi:membrane associated rhomboid family serine protease